MPAVEPEVLMDGEHSLERSFDVTEEVLRTVFNQLYAQRVLVEGMILKPNMERPGLTSPKPEAVGRIQCRDGEDMSITTRISRLTRSAA
jgi:fructose-bisphosphate aldolase, class I